jgi:sirohydrochlorin cobaltochelatase
MKRAGVLVIAHGSSKSDWVKLVDQAVAEVELDLPIVTSFLEMVAGRTIPDGIHMLEKQGVTEIMVVPLFVSAGSTHMEEIGYRLGLIRHPKLEIKQEPWQREADVQLCQAMDDHPFIAQILLERAQEMSTNPEEEALLLVGHGSELEGFRQIWEKGMASLAVQLRRELGVAKSSFAMLHPDQLRQRLQVLSRDYRVLLLPLFLSAGYFTRKVIPAKIAGLNTVYTGKTYLPSPLISRWIEAVVKEQQR